MKKLCVLGITGSIGKSVIKVVDNNKDRFKIVAAAFNTNFEEFSKIIDKLPYLEIVAVSDENTGLLVKKTYPHLYIYTGASSVSSLIDENDFDMVVNAIVGFNGLIPTIHCINKGVDLALANKESLVVGGELINELLKTSKTHLYPIDSEHSAIWKCLKNKNIDDVDHLVITASGGALRDVNINDLPLVTPKQALNHPSWHMGDKITIDSATMMNKGFEIIEAHYLFNFPLEKIKVLMHDESIIHSAIVMKDHSMVADMGVPDMQIPIAFALNEGEYQFLEGIDNLSLEAIGTLHFRKYDQKRYPCVELAKRALNEGGSMLCVLNAANEAVNLAFRNDLIKFNNIENIIEKVMNEHKLINKPTLEQLIEINNWAYNYAMELVERNK